MSPAAPAVPHPSGAPDPAALALDFALRSVLSANRWEDAVPELLRHWSAMSGIAEWVLAENRMPDGDDMEIAVRWSTGAPPAAAAALDGRRYGAGGLARWRGELSAGRELESSAAARTGAERDALTGVRDLALAPVFVDRTWWGLVGGVLDPAPANLREARRLWVRSLANLVGLAQARVRAAHHALRLETVVEQTAEVILITDARGVIEYVNGAFEIVTGYTRDEVLGHTPRILKSGQHGEAFYRDLWETITRGHPWYGRFINRRKNGSLYREEATITPIRDHTGAIAHFVANKRDITREIEIEDHLRQTQKMEALGLLAGGVAHDFNSALTPILACSEMALAEAAPASPQYDLLLQIQKSAERASTLTKELLSFSRKREPNLAAVHLNEVLQGLEATLHRLVGDRIRLRMELAADLGSVAADPAQIEQIVINLAMNARDAMPEGGPLVLRTEPIFLDADFARTWPGVVPGRHVLLSVRDAGCGIPPEILDHIFEPFFTTKESGKGTGLGLATVYGILRQLGGAVTVQSTPGAGSVFKIYMPEVADLPDRQKPASAEPPPTAGHRETVLVVEDDDNVRALTVSVLRKFGYRTQDFNDAESALQYLRSHQEPVHLLLADVILPRMSGSELMHWARELRPSMNVLFMSGYSGYLLEQQGIQPDSMPFLQKPFTMTTLARKVREVLDGEAHALPPAPQP